MKPLTPNTKRLNSETFENPLGQKLGMKIVSASTDLSIISMPVTGNTQIAGVLHGGATAALCETAASISASLCAKQVAEKTKLDKKALAVGTELSISHLRPATSGIVTATAEALHKGRTSTVHLVKVIDESNNLIATATVTNRLLFL